MSSSSSNNNNNSSNDNDNDNTPNDTTKQSSNKAKQTALDILPDNYVSPQFQSTPNSPHNL